jgi:hypothetical protein
MASTRCCVHDCAEACVFDDRPAVNTALCILYPLALLAAIFL